METRLDALRVGLLSVPAAEKKVASDERLLRITEKEPIPAVRSTGVQVSPPPGLPPLLPASPPAPPRLLTPPAQLVVEPSSRDSSEFGVESSELLLRVFKCWMGLASVGRKRSFETLDAEQGQVLSFEDFRQRIQQVDVDLPRVSLRISEL